MIDHLSVAVRSLEDSTRFYEAVLGTIGYCKLVVRPTSVGFGKTYPVFWLNGRPGMSAVTADTGNHVALRAKGQAEVEEFHRVALASGGTDGGAPAIRQYTRASVFAAFIVDPDGNRVEIMTIMPSGENTG